jgi:23S rRNA (cytosine1962-C5)-methyltransferase
VCPISTPADPSTRPRIAVRLAPNALREVRRGHPWVFDQSIASTSRPGEPGDLAVIFDDKRNFVAIGLWDPTSPIRIKLLHHGAPTTINQEFFSERIRAAIEVRQSLIDSPHTNAFRLIHGENDRLPGLVVDRYDTTTVVKLYSPAWFPFLDMLVDHLGDNADTVVLRLARSVGPFAPPDRVDGTVLRGPVPHNGVEFIEHQLRFRADVLRGQKTGHFLDQRENRLLVRGISQGERVLDVFCCTGGFSVNAAAGGAASVHSVDIAPSALQATNEHIQANADRAQVRAAKHTSTTADAFATLDRLRRKREQFDLVIVDPPSFTSHQGTVSTALSAYRRLNLAAASVVTPGGTLFTASCSARIEREDFRGAVEAGIEAAGATFSRRRETGQPIDHPIGFREGEYLKAAVYRLHF